MGGTTPYFCGRVYSGWATAGSRYGVGTSGARVGGCGWARCHHKVPVAGGGPMQTHPKAKRNEITGIMLASRVRKPTGECTPPTVHSTTVTRNPLR